LFGTADLSGIGTDIRNPDSPPQTVVDSKFVDMDKMGPFLQYETTRAVKMMGHTGALQPEKVHLEATEVNRPFTWRLRSITESQIKAAVAEDAILRVFLGKNNEL
jgi:hypothetical protein